MLSKILYRNGVFGGDRQLNESAFQAVIANFIQIHSAHAWR